MSQTIAFLGATGDCAGYCLAAALKEGYTCRALARNPSKLETSLQAKGISSDTLSNLEITEGNAKDVAAVKKLLTPKSGAIVDAIVFGIGAAPKLRWHIMPVTLDDPTVCQTAMATVMAALQELGAARKPRLIAVSTTGLTQTRDVPIALYLLYHWLLAVPHKDKRAMEDLVWAAKDKSEDQKVVGDVVVLRASLLVNGSGSGLDAVRFGFQNKPAIGYTIARKDVGDFIFEKLVKPEQLGEFKDQAVTVTY